MLTLSRLRRASDKLNMGVNFLPVGVLMIVFLVVTLSFHYSKLEFSQKPF